MIRVVFDRDRMYLYPWYLADECLTLDIKDIFGKKVDKIILEFNKGHLKYYAEVGQYNEIGQYLFDRVKQDKTFYDLVESKVLSLGEDLMKFCNNLKNIDLKKPQTRSCWKHIKSMLKS